MSVIGSSILAGASGGAVGGSPLYVDDVFSTDLYVSDGSTQTVNNGIKLGAPSESLNGKTITDTTGGGADYSKLNNNITSSANSDYYYGSIDCYIDYGSAVVSTSYSLFPQGDNSQSPKVVYNTPDSVTAYGSNNASSWTTLGTTTFTASDWAEGQATKAVFENLTAYRYYRLTVAGTKSLQEWHLGIGQSGEGGLVWFKNRTSAWNHILVDSERSGANNAGNSTLYPLVSNSSGAQLINVLPTSFNNNGYTTAYNIGSSEKFVSWTFRKAPGFFDVVTYSGDSDPNRTISHNLGSTPGMIIVKGLQANRDWVVHHRSVGFTKYMVLNSSVESLNIGGRISAADASTFTPGSDSDTNQTGKTYVAYIFAHDDASFGTDGDESIIKCGAYTGTGSSGNFVNLGFEPQWLLIKKTTASGSNRNWWLSDTMRGMVAGAGDEFLFPNSSSGKSSGWEFISPNPNGFTVTTGDDNFNTSGIQYVYMAIRRPNKPPELATEVFAMDTGSTSSTTPTFDSGFVVDAAIEDNYFHSRLMGPKSIQSYLGDRGESADSLSTWDSNVGWGKSYNSGTLSYMFKRAPGFMDVVTYVGNDAAGRNIGHNLEAVPEIMIAKVRSTSHASYSYWAVYYKSSTAGGATKYLILNEDDGETTHSTVPWNGTDPTSTQFTVYNSWAVNRGGYNYVNFLFTTLPGISKVGTYSGTGNAINIDCGFTNGARFVMIKRTNGTGDWYYWDTFNGIVSGNDSYSRLNLSPSRVTGTDYIDPNVYGFTVTSSAPAALNATGGTYLFLAIA